MSLRTLYLNPKGQCVVTLDAGVALRISTEQTHHIMRVPLRQLSRIISSQSVCWNSNAIIACLKYGVPIQFTNRRGEAIGWCLGTRRVESTTANLLSSALSTCDWHDRYKQWLNNQTRARAAQLLVLCQLPATDNNIRNVRNVICNLHRVRHGAPAGRHIRAITELNRAEVANALINLLGDPRLVAWQLEGLNLIDDLTEITSMHAHAVLHFCAVLPKQIAMTKWAIEEYESNASMWAESIGELIGSFERFLREHWL